MGHPLFLAPIFRHSGFRQDVLAAHTSPELIPELSSEGSVRPVGTKASWCASAPWRVNNALTQSSRESTLHVLEEHFSFLRLLSLNICNLDARAYSISCDS